MTPEENKSYALLLAIADVTFSNTEELLQHVQKLAIADSDPAYPGLITGIVVSYCRPFGNNRGLGTLPERFRRPGFLNELDLQPVHDLLLQMRNKLFAHHDLEAFEKLTAGVSGLRPPDEMEFEFTDEGFAVMTNELRPPVALLGLVGKLLVVQRAAIKHTLFEHMGTWLKTRPPNGTYRLSATGFESIGGGLPPAP